MLLDPSSAIQSSTPRTIKEPLYTLNFKDKNISHREDYDLIARAEDRVDSGGSIIRTDSSRPPVPRYKVATIVVRNDSQKPVRSVEWEFVYLCKGKKRVLQRYIVKSERKIKPGNKQTLVKRIKLPHQQEVTCSRPSNESPFLWVEESPSSLAVIRRVEYADGTAWQQDAP